MSFTEAQCETFTEAQYGSFTEAQYESFTEDQYEFYKSSSGFILFTHPQNMVISKSECLL